MKKILVICGPTATGKTHLSLMLAKSFEGELLSVDSRQVFKNLTIGTGKDIPDGSVWKDKYWLTKEGIRIWGYDIVDVDGEIHVASYCKYAEEVLKDIYERQRLPILVGGTGLYITALVDGIETIEVPKDKDLRSSLDGKSASELFEILAPLDPIKAAALNSSDRKNPRRLIRAIEVAKASSPKKHESRKYDLLIIGLTAPVAVLKARVEDRAKSRLQLGLLKEIEDLISQGVGWNSQAMSSLGYKEWKDYFDGSTTLDDAFNEWVKNEHKYLKRQITWFKRDSRINWFDITERNWRKKVEALVKTWYK